jgi:hypothetical protein
MKQFGESTEVLRRDPAKAFQIALTFDKFMAVLISFFRISVFA